MSARDDSGPAFPMPAEYNLDGQCICAPQYGMTLRDAAALAALPAHLADLLARPPSAMQPREVHHVASTLAFATADAFIAARGA